MENSVSNRAETASKIVESPQNYKVCEGCDSIVGRSASICPNCHSFRFDIDAESVVSQAVLLGSREQRSVTAEDLS